MAAKKRRAQRSAASGGESKGEAGTRLRRTDEEKIRLVRQVMASSNQSTEIKSLGIYPNQFYDWKKKFAEELGGAAPTAMRGKRGRPAAPAHSATEEAKAFINGKAALLERLRKQRSEIDALIAQLEA